MRTVSFLAATSSRSSGSLLTDPLNTGVFIMRLRVMSSPCCVDRREPSRTLRRYHNGPKLAVSLEEVVQLHLSPGAAHRHRCSRAGTNSPLLRFAASVSRVYACKLRPDDLLVLQALWSGTQVRRARRSLADTPTVDAPRTHARCRPTVVAVILLVLGRWQPELRCMHVLQVHHAAKPDM